MIGATQGNQFAIKRGRAAEEQGMESGCEAPAEQMPLFGVDPESQSSPVRRKLLNPHLLAARRLAKKMRQLPDHSAEETRAGLAICRQLKAYLQEEPGAHTGTETPNLSTDGSPGPPNSPRH
jgi:hypothetical protein